jgi:hypothetical protein
MTKLLNPDVIPFMAMKGSINRELKAINKYVSPITFIVVLKLEFQSKPKNINIQARFPGAIEKF